MVQTLPRTADELSETAVFLTPEGGRNIAPVLPLKKSPRVMF